MNQRTQGVGSAAHCGSARSPLLGPGAEHLSHKKEVREAAGSRPLEPAHLQPGTGVLGTDRKLRPRIGRGRSPHHHPSCRSQISLGKFTRNSGRLQDHQPKPHPLYGHGWKSPELSWD